MDIKCPKCGEPWDMDSLHDETDYRLSRPEWAGKEYSAVYSEVSADFRAEGCRAIYGAKCSGATADPVVAVLYDLLGDDLDGAASIFDDLDFLDFDI